MSAISSTLPRLQLPLSVPSVERGKPVASIKSLSRVSSPQSLSSSATLFALAKEPEDAVITGGTRSLERRLLALNLVKPRASSTNDPR